MSRISLVALVLLAGLFAANASYAYSLQQADSFLVNYNVPAALVALLKPVYINYSGIEYVVMYNGTTLIL